MKTNYEFIPVRFMLASRTIACATVLLLTLRCPGTLATLASSATLFDHTADAKDVVNKLVAEDYEGIRANFNEKMKSGLSAEKMKEVWKSVLEHAGAFQSQGTPQTQNTQGWEIIVIPCQMERAKINVEVDYDSDGKIGGLWIKPAK